MKKIEGKDPVTGETGLWKLAEETWADLTVIHHETGEEIGKDGLHRVPWKRGHGWEATEYDPETNVAKSAYLADYSPSQIRTFKFAVTDIISTFGEEVDAAYEDISTRHRRAQEDAMREKKQLVKDAEYSTRADGEMPNSPLEDYLETTAGDDEYDGDGSVSEVFEQQNTDSDSTGDGSDGGDSLPTDGGEDQ